MTQLLASCTLDYINSFHPMLVSFGDHLYALEVKVSSLLGQQRDLGAYGMTPEMELMKICEDLLGYFDWVDEAKRNVVKAQLARGKLCQDMQASLEENSGDIEENLWVLQKWDDQAANGLRSDAALCYHNSTIL